jgi:aspartate racemase
MSSSHSRDPQGRRLSAGQQHLVGIYGGVGPFSHTVFEQHVLASSHRRGARNDQEHPVWILASASSTPNRMASLAGTGENAAGHLRHYAQVLERAGADVLFVICNTAHAYHEQVQRELRIPWVHLMAITVDEIRRTMPDVRRVGVVGTDGTLTTGLYHRALASRGLEAVAPEVGSAEQRRVMAAIFDPARGIKATGASVSDWARESLAGVADWTAETGAQAVIAACTEVSAVLTPGAYRRIPVVDPLLVAADLLVALAFGERAPEEFVVRY